MNRKILFRISAMVAVALAPLAAAGQVNPEAAPGPGQAAHYKYEVYAGAAYTRFRQATESYSGLLGGKASVARDWGKYFQLIASGDYYTVGSGHQNLPSPGHPSIYSFLVGPGVHANLYGNLSGEIFTELGLEHTGGERMTPNISFAGGFGGGLTYDLGHNFGVRLAADRVGASFSLANNTPQLAYSTHLTWNARATLGVVYRF
ncbi:MAG TPA: hypothetical protein VJX73_16505 [Terracidiphilus sp.]|nr:hypothetical protein [Terracidiphilus sp.]